MREQRRRPALHSPPDSSSVLQTGSAYSSVLDIQNAIPRARKRNGNLLMYLPKKVPFDTGNENDVPSANHRFGARFSLGKAQPLRPTHSLGSVSNESRGRCCQLSCTHGGEFVCPFDSQ